MRVSLETLKDRAGWEKAGVRLPAFDVEQMRKKTEEAPIWVHFGAGNIPRNGAALGSQNSCCDIKRTHNKLFENRKPCFKQGF